MKVLRSLCALAITMLAANSMWAQQGTTHDHPISDALVSEYLTKYIGFDGDSWGTPTETVASDVIFIQVNDYWKGSNWDNTPSIEDQVRYGVKQIDKVTQHAKIGSGDLYHFDATTNRFFFAIRTSSRYTSNSSYNMPFRWYNEFSSTSSTSGDGWNSLNAAYDQLKDGDFYPVPHSCSNSLEKNHFTSLYAKTTTGETYTISAMLFVPSGANASTNNKNGSYSSSNIPQVFFYVSSLEGVRVKNTVAGSACEYSAKLNWQTSFDKAKASTAVDFTAWNSTNGGVKEESTIYRKVADGKWEVVKTGDLIDTKEFTDNTLPNAGTEGYSVEYYVVTNAVTYDKNGNRTGNVMGTTTTNHIILHIPGSESFFELEITNDFNSKYNPSNGTFGAGTNTITNTVKPSANEFSPKIGDIKQGDKLELVRMENGKANVAANTVNITEISSEHIYEDVTRTFSVSGTFNNTGFNTQISNETLKKAGYNAYGITSTTLSNSTRTANTTITFDGKEYPRTIYVRLRKSASGATATATVTSGGSGTITAVQSSSTEISTSLSDYTPITMTSNTLVISTTVKRSSSGQNAGFVILVPNNIKEKVEKGITTTYKYTVNGEEASIKDPADLEPILKAAANYTETVNVAPGEIYDVKYQMVYTSADGKTVLRSNTVASKSMTTEVKAEKLYRSGTPDVVTDADKKEVYTCRVSFKPILDNRVAHYHIWMNGTDKLMRVGQSGETFTLVGKDANGQFNVDLGPIYTDDYGFLNVLVDAEVSKRANPEELQGNENPFINNDLFFTVEVCATGDNTYGNIDATENYKGYNSELVYNSRANIFYGEGSVTGYFRAEVDWIRAFDPKFMDDDDIVKDEPAFFTVHRKLAGETVYSPLKNFYIEDAETGYKPYLEEAGEEAFQFTPELIEELSLKQKVGFKAIDIFEKKDWTVSNAFPAMYYVKAYFKTNTAAKAMRKANFVNASEQYIVKNSNPTTTTQPIPTAVDDVNVSEVVSVKYYNLMGVEVMNPAAGEIVIARKQYANGTSTSKVIKM